MCYISAIRKRKSKEKQLTRKIQYIGPRCDGITWFVIYKLIERNVRKAGKKIVQTHRKQSCDLIVQGIRAKILQNLKQIGIKLNLVWLQA